MPNTKSHIRDTQDFISKITKLGPITEGAILATLDVTSLYTNIPNQEGLVAVTEHMRKDPSKGPIANYILDLVKLELHNMSFEVNNGFFLQIGGTAMGTAVTPNYANLFMDRFETKALENYPLKPLIWKRFIDDIFLIWTHGEDLLKDFVNYLNQLHPTINFTSETSTESINFLDTNVKLDSSRHIITSLYNKPTDTHLFLHYSSAHPESVPRTGPYGQYLRLRRICTLDRLPGKC